MGQKRRSYTKEFKAEAVALVLEKGLSQSQVARDLNLAPSTLGKWVKTASSGSTRSGTSSLAPAEREELTRLRRENRILREERIILKKAAAFFASENR